MRHLKIHGKIYIALDIRCDRIQQFSSKPNTAKPKNKQKRVNIFEPMTHIEFISTPPWIQLSLVEYTEPIAAGDWEYLSF